jgi:dTDP-glucose 4,6-dehydratase
VIPTIISQALTRDSILLGNLSARRDLTYVSDTTAGFLLAGQTEGMEGKTINLGTGVDISIGELADKIIKIVGKEIEVTVDPSRIRPAKSEVTRLLSDYSLAKELMGWRPQVSLEQGLVKTVAWVASNLGMYNPDRYNI